MKALNQKPRPIHIRQHSFTVALALICALTTATGVFAQTVIVGPPIIPVIKKPISEPKGETNELDSTTSLNGTASPTSQGPQNPFQWGPVTVHPSVGYNYSYGTGIQSQPGQAQRTAINTASLGLGLDLGDYWQFHYTAGAAFYSDTNFNNNVDHTFSLAGKTSYQDWTFDVAQNIAFTSDPQVATGQQTDQRSMATALGANYQLNSDYSIDLTANQNFLNTSGYTNAMGVSRDWSTMEWLNYHWAPTLSTGIGLGGGYSTMENGPNMTHEDFSGRVSWQTFKKISLTLSVGGQVRQFLGTDQPSLLTPTYSLGLVYRPLSATSLFVNASRGVGSSYFQDSITINSSVSLGVSQRLFQRFYLTLNGGLSLTTYQNSLDGLSGRDDHYHFVNIGLSTTFLKHGTASVNYSVSKNTSKNSSGFSYDSNQIGVSVGYGY